MLCLSFRSNFKLVAVNSKLYAIGGQAVSNVECYNPEQDAWNFVAPLPNPLAEFSACECKGKIYVIGGYTTRGKWRGQVSGSLISKLCRLGQGRGCRRERSGAYSVILCITYRVLTYLEGSKACKAGRGRPLTALCEHENWMRGSCEENRHFLSALETQSCRQSSCDLAGWLPSFSQTHSESSPPNALGFSARAPLQTSVFIISLTEHKHIR